MHASWFNAEELGECRGAERAPDAAQVHQDLVKSDAGRGRLVIVGGGFSATAMAVQLVRSTRVPLDITIVEPRKQVGPGLAYSATDPDHRLNAPIDVHWIDPRDPFELRRWYEANNVFDLDPACFTSNGQVFLRRADFGKYLSAQIALYSNNSRLGSTIQHVCDTATSAQHENGGYRVRTESHGEFDGEMLIIATGNPVPSLRPPFKPEHAKDPRIIANPLEPGCIDNISPGARVLVVGSGLTALDIVSTLVRRYCAEILVVSRRGLRPRPQSPESLTLPPPKRIELSTIVPEFIQTQPETVRAWTKALRQQIGKEAAEGRNWYATFDSVRDVVWQIWPRLAYREQLRFLKRLRVFYDVHRFRTPPMNEAMVGEAERAGCVRYAAATLMGVDATPGSGVIKVELLATRTQKRRWEKFDVVINCTGLDAGVAWRSNPFLQSLIEQGLVLLHPTGIGFDVNAGCCAVGSDGRVRDSLRVIGPPTSGAFGDPIGVPFIAAQIRRILPSILETLGIDVRHLGEP